jgi:hypothetical protein
MVVEIAEGVRITGEAQNFVLEKRRIVQEGKNAGAVEWDTVGYYGSLRDAAVALLKRHFALLEETTGAATAKDLQGLIDAVDYGADLIARACSVKVAVPA